MAKMNKQKLQAYTTKSDQLESNIDFYTSYMPLAKKELNDKLEKQIAKATINCEKSLLKSSIKANKLSDYGKTLRSNKLEVVTKTFDLKKRAAKQTLLRTIKSKGEVVANEQYKQQIEKIELAEKAAINKVNQSFKTDDAQVDQKQYAENKKLFEAKRDQKIKKLKENKVQSETNLTKRIENKILRLKNKKTEIDQLIDQHADTLKESVAMKDDVILKLDHLSMHFGGLKAVDDLNFEVKKGEIFGLIGPNGAGKTTVFNCITRFYRATEGQVYYRNHHDNVINLNDFVVHDVIKQGIVRTFQNVELVWQLNILDNLLVGTHSTYQSNFFEHMLNSRRIKQEEKVNIDKAFSILEKLGLEAYAYQYPIGLPYGILKKVELARTLMTNPRMIILDEPAAGLNDTETLQLAQTIRQIRDEYNTTIFLVEHDMGLVMDICDRICAISFGKKLAIGTPKDIQTNDHVKEAYLGG